MSHQANHDALTGLPNRAAFERCLEQTLQRGAGRTGLRGRDATRPGAVLYVDVDQFKIVNDTCGHDVGDEVLRRMATALLTQVRGRDVLARLGGDEFGVLLPGRTMNEARIFAARLRTLLSGLGSSVGDDRLTHTVSIGIAMLDEAKGSARRLLSNADVACFSAKERGRDRVEVYGARSGRDSQTQMEWVSRVRRACDEQRFVLYHQRIVPLDGSAARPHYELLLRMVDSTGKVIMPAAFIPAAERYNIMSRVDRWIVRRVLTELVWREDLAPQAPYMLSVNLSGTSLRDPQFRRDVLDLLDRYPVAPDTLCFEVTETAAVGDLRPVVMFMNALKARGCRFSLDDFGTGMASFAYLRDLPVDFL
ncbi:MAG: diguanylate cyclase, partial [Pseudomonadota bacterium]